MECLSLYFSTYFFTSIKIKDTEIQTQRFLENWSVEFTVYSHQSLYCLAFLWQQNLYREIKCTARFAHKLIRCKAIFVYFCVYSHFDLIYTMRFFQNQLDDIWINVFTLLVFSCILPPNDLISPRITFWRQATITY